MSPARRIVPCVLAAGLLLVHADVRAQTPPPAVVATAREQFRAGIAAAQRGAWNEAREAFARSHALLPRPLTLLDLAGAESQSGRLVQSAEHYRQFLREATTPPAMVHRDDAATALAAVERRIPRLRVQVVHLEPEDRVLLDGVALAAAMLAVEVPLDPGEHALELRRAGTIVARATARLAEGRREEVRLEAPATAAVTEPSAAPRTDTVRAPAGRVALRPRVATTVRPAPVPVRRHDGGVLSSPWLWTAVGVVLVGSAATALVLTVGADTGEHAGNVPPSRLGVP